MAKPLKMKLFKLTADENTFNTRADRIIDDKLAIVRRILTLPAGSVVHQIVMRPKEELKTRAGVVRNASFGVGTRDNGNLQTKISPGMGASDWNSHPNRVEWDATNHRVRIEDITDISAVAVGLIAFRRSGGLRLNGSFHRPVNAEVEVRDPSSGLWQGCRPRNDSQTRHFCARDIFDGWGRTGGVAGLWTMDIRSLTIGSYTGVWSSGGSYSGEMLYAATNADMPSYVLPIRTDNDSEPGAKVALDQDASPVANSVDVVAIAEDVTTSDRFGGGASQGFYDILVRASVPQ